MTNLKGLLARATSLTPERAQALVEEDMKANAHRYAPASADSEAMDSETVLAEDQDGPDVPERQVTVAVKSVLEIDEQLRNSHVVHVTVMKAPTVSVPKTPRNPFIPGRTTPREAQPEFDYPDDELDSTP